MAWSNSKVFGAFFEDLLNGTYAHDLDTDTIKIALFTNSITPDNTVSSANSAYNAGQWASGANEVKDSTRWNAGGETLASKTLTRSSAVVTFDAADQASAAATTMTDIYGGLVYNTSRSSRGICYLYFGGASAVSNGVFTVVFNASGISTFTAS